MPNATTVNSQPVPSSDDDDLLGSVHLPPGAKTILVVDDVKTNLLLIGGLLQPYYQVRVANSGARALAAVLGEPFPDLILLDIMMPEMDGYQVLEKLRADPRTASIPVIFVTAMNEDEDEERGLALGAVDYITKPLRAGILLARVRTHLELKQSRDQLSDQNAWLEFEVARRTTENRAQQRLRESILAASGEAILGIDAQGAVNFANPAAATMFGLTPGEMLGQAVHDLLHPGEAESEQCPLLRVLESQAELRDFELHFEGRDNGDSGPRIGELSCLPIAYPDHPGHRVITLRDITRHKRYLQQIEYNAHYDVLTGLANRTLLADRIHQAIARALIHAEDAGTAGFVLMLFKLDRFATLTESLGYQAGDAVLQELVARLKRVLPAEGTLARLEGDEFVFLCETCTADDAAHFAQATLAGLSPAFSVAEREVFVSSSIGICLYPADGETVDELLKSAAAAMYQAQGEGGNRVQFFARDLHQQAVQRLELETHLRIALANPGQNFVLHYQPQVNLRTGELIGTEALVRWQHPERGLLPPDTFIALAEAAGLIKPLGEWILRSACIQNKAWQDSGLPAIKVAVNLSAHQFGGVDMVDLTRQIVQETGLDPRHLELELTETAAMADAEGFIAATSQLKGLSITLTIDDFGTGFSSLSYLQRFSIDRLKIDTSFIHDVAQDPASAAVARAIISLAHDLGLIAVAEGVETEAQLQFLRRHACDEMQGFYFSPAIPADALADLLRQGRRIDFSTSTPEATRRVLCVDDEPNILSALRRLFRRDGYQVLVANSGVECLEIMATEDVGVVIVDARMPEMDGAQLLSKVRQLYPQVVRLMLSGYTDLKAVTEAVNRGELFRFMTKPWDDAELLEAVRAAFNYHDSLRRKQGPVENISDP